MDFVRSYFGTNEPLTSWKKVFNWSEVHLSKMTCYKIHTLRAYCPNILYTVRERHVFIWYCTWLACLFVKLQHDKTVDNPQEGSFVKHFKISKADPTLAFSSRNFYVHTTQNDCTISGEKIGFGSLVLLF